MIFRDQLEQLIRVYSPDLPLAEARTIPGCWYTDERLLALEQHTVFSSAWHFGARLDQLPEPGDYVTTEIAGEPIVIVRGSDNSIRGFFNVCRHHAAAVMTETAGHANQLRCPYHGWTYSLEGALKGTPDFAGVCNFDRSSNGLLPVATAVWEKWVFVRIGSPHSPPANGAEAHCGGPSLQEFLGTELTSRFRDLYLENLHWMEQRRYLLNCNWKVFVDNYLDGGYHVPHLHHGLDSVLDYSNYTIENGEHFCLQSSPMVRDGQEHVSAVRAGERASYYWLYPNFMINCYDGVMDTNLVIPRGLSSTEVVFDFYFADISAAALEQNRASIDVGQQIQGEDVAICESVQRGLGSRAYQAGRLSVRREAGEHLFHRLLYADLLAGVAD